MRKRNKVVSLLLAGCMAACLLAGCGSSGGTQVATADNATAASTSTGAADSAAPDSAAPETAGEVDGQINLRAVAFGNNFDVQDMGWRWMMGECYEGLMRDVADENGDRFEYAGAESMDVSDDGLVYTFHLRKDAKWSDGQPVTAADYEFTGAQHTALADAVNTAEILRLSKDADKFERVMKPVLDLFRPDKDQPTLLDMCPEFFASFMEESAGSE